MAALNKYIAFLFFVLINLVIFSCTEECVPSSGQRYLVMSPKSGFGNRLQAVASAAAWAEKTDRKLIIDWQRENKHMPALWNDLFKSPKLDTLETNADFDNKCTKDALLYRYLPDNTFTSSVRHGTPGVSQYRQIIPGIYYPPVEDLKVDRNPIAYFFKLESRMPSDTFPHQDKIQKFYKTLEPVDSVKKEINSVLAQHVCDTKLGFHFRSFATPADLEWSGTATPVDTFLADVDTRLKKLGVKLSNKSCIFVASDSPKYRQYIEEKLKNKYNTKLLSLNLKQVERDTVRGQQDALVEWYLLASMDYLFGSNESSFSDEAGRLTAHGKKISIGPPAYAHHVNNFDPL